MSPIEEKFHLNCVAILNNVACHTPNKELADRVLKLFLRVDLKRCWSVWILGFVARTENTPAVPSALWLLRRQHWLQRWRSKRAFWLAIGWAQKPLSCFFHFKLCPASSLVFYYMVKKTYPKHSNFQNSLQGSINLIRKQNRVIVSTIWYMDPILSPETVPFYQRHFTEIRQAYFMDAYSAEIYHITALSSQTSTLVSKCMLLGKKGSS